MYHFKKTASSSKADHRKERGVKRNLEGEWYSPAFFQTIPRVKPFLALSLEAEQTFSLPAPLPCAWKPISTDMN